MGNRWNEFARYRLLVVEDLNILAVIQPDAVKKEYQNKVVFTFSVNSQYFSEDKSGYQVTDVLLVDGLGPNMLELGRKKISPSVFLYKGDVFMVNYDMSFTGITLEDFQKLSINEMFDLYRNQKWK